MSYIVNIKECRRKMECRFIKLTYVFSLQPIGALNPKRAVFYAERYETWENDQTPPYHYNTHYSTSTCTLAWLVRIVSIFAIFIFCIFIDKVVAVFCIF